MGWDGESKSARFDRRCGGFAWVDSLTSNQFPVVWERPRCVSPAMFGGEPCIRDGSPPVMECPPSRMELRLGQAFLRLIRVFYVHVDYF